MQDDNRLVGNTVDSVGNTPFMHVNPDTGKYTTWTLEITDTEADGRCE